MSDDTKGTPTRPDVEAIRHAAATGVTLTPRDVPDLCDWVVHLERRSPESTLDGRVRRTAEACRRYEPIHRPYDWRCGCQGCDVLRAGRKAFVSGAEYEAARTPEPTEDDREVTG